MNDNIYATTPHLTVEVCKGKSIYTAYMSDQRECELCYEVFNSTAEYLFNLNKEENFPNRNFMIDDVVGLLGNDGVKQVKNIINILWIRTAKNSRNKGMATKLMSEFLNLYANSDDTIVVFRVSATEKDYPTEPTSEQYSELFNHMVKFLVPFGFVSIQDLCGLEFSDPYLYLSPTSEAAKFIWNKFVDYYMN